MLEATKTGMSDGPQRPAYTNAVNEFLGYSSFRYVHDDDSMSQPTPPASCISLYRMRSIIHTADCMRILAVMALFAVRGPCLCRMAQPTCTQMRTGSQVSAVHVDRIHSYV